MDAGRQFEIRQEARFVLWALRCAVAHERGDAAAHAELLRGFELADVLETAAPFREFVRVLCSVEWTPAAWHHPQCSCVSNEELIVLQALADTWERLRCGDSCPGTWWQVLVPASVAGRLDADARLWLDALRGAGVAFPRSAELIESLRLLENMAQPAAAAQLH